MPIVRRNPSCCYKGLIAVIAITLTAYGCASGPAVVGNWQAVEGSGSVSFLTDGVFHAVDNEGMAVSGKYRLVGAGGLRFEVLHGDHETEVIDARVAREENLLMLTFPGEAIAETYRRIP